MTTQTDVFEPLPQAPLVPAFFAETAPVGTPATPSPKLQIFARHSVLMALCGGLAIDQRVECYDRLRVTLDGIDQSLAATPAGQRKAKLQARIEETRARLLEMRDEQAAAEKRHFDALAADDQTELVAARKAVLASGVEMQITTDELATLSRLHHDCVVTIDAERKRLAPHCRAVLVDQTGASIDRLVSELWGQITSPAMLEQFQALVLHSGLRAICGSGLAAFERNCEQYQHTGTVTA